MFSLSPNCKRKKPLRGVLLWKNLTNGSVSFGKLTKHPSRASTTRYRPNLLAFHGETIYNTGFYLGSRGRYLSQVFRTSVCSLLTYFQSGSSNPNRGRGSTAASIPKSSAYTSPCKARAGDFSSICVRPYHRTHNAPKPITARTE